MAERIGIIGSGIMGAGIAQIATQNGYEVIMTDVGQEQLGRRRGPDNHRPGQGRSARPL